MTFSKPWIAFPQDPETRVPVLDVCFRTAEGQETREPFIVDSGADVSLATRYLCDALGLEWETGNLVEIQGIVAREECKVVTRLHHVEIYVRDADRRFTIPICFADSDDAPLLLGREGFFDAFTVSFDKKNLQTRFDW
jgi:hypothetical protein